MSENGNHEHDLTELIGQDLGAYTVERLIGQGGMGSVFLGRHRMLGTPAAIKVLAPEYSQNPEMVARFEREARNAAALNHPNVVSVFDIGRTNSGLIYMCMPFIEGRSLRAIIDDGPMPVVEAMLLMDKVLEAIAYAHARTVLHRDLKPDNIIITPEGYPRITDFGLARNMSSDVQLTHVGQVIGTPLYMPVEQWDAENLDERTDIYALGITFYEMLCGKPPFPPDLQPGHLFRLVAAADFLEPREIDDNIPEVVETVCLKMMALDATKRFASAEEARNDLLDALETLKEQNLVPADLTRQINAARIDSKIGHASSAVGTRPESDAERPVTGGAPGTGSARPGTGTGLAPGSSPKGITPIRPAAGSGSITPARSRTTTTPISPIRPVGGQGPASGSGSGSGTTVPPPPGTPPPFGEDEEADVGVASASGADSDKSPDATADTGNVEVPSPLLDTLAAAVEDILPNTVEVRKSDVELGDTLLSIGGDDGDQIAKAAEDAFAALEQQAGGSEPEGEAGGGDDEIVELTEDMMSPADEAADDQATAALPVPVDSSDDGWGPSEISDEERHQAEMRAREVTAVVERALVESSRDIPADPFAGIESDDGGAAGTASSGTKPKKGCAGVLLAVVALPLLAVAIRSALALAAG